jgi:hypothetical protein
VYIGNKEATRMSEQELAKLREEVQAGYEKRINWEMTDEEFEVYTKKDHLLIAIERAMR